MEEFTLNKNSYIGNFRNMEEDIDIVADALKSVVEARESDTLKEVYRRKDSSKIYGEAYEYLTVGIFEKVEEFVEKITPFTIRTLLNNTNKELLMTEFNVLNKMYTIIGANMSELIKVIETKMILDEKEFEIIFNRIVKNIDDTLDAYDKSNEERDKILSNKYRKTIWLYTKIISWQENYIYTEEGKEI